MSRESWTWRRAWTGHARDLVVKASPHGERVPREELVVGAYEGRGFTGLFARVEFRSMPSRSEQHVLLARSNTHALCQGTGKEKVHTASACPESRSEQHVLLARSNTHAVCDAHRLGALGIARTLSCSQCSHKENDADVVLRPTGRPSDRRPPWLRPDRRNNHLEIYPTAAWAISRSVVSGDHPLAGHLGEAKIDDLEAPTITLADDDAVLLFHVAMDDALDMQSREPEQELMHPACGRRPGHLQR